jgi:hypothetical protein
LFSSWPRPPCWCCSPGCESGGDQWAQREIQRIEGTLMPPQGEAETYHTQLSFIVRRYLTEQFGLHALQQTTTEFLEAVRQVPQVTAEQKTQLTTEQQALLRELFERCDLAKFARARTLPEECRRTAELARELVRQTAQLANGQVRPRSAQRSDT